MHGLTINLASGAAAWNGPAWVLILVVVSSLFSLASSIISGFIVHRNRAIDDRLRQGDQKFDKIMADQATLAVDAALKNGEVRQAMYRDFVTRDEFQKHSTRMAAFEAETLKGMSRVETKLDVLIKREGGSRAT